MTPYRDLLEQLGHETDRGLDEQRNGIALYGIAASAASAAAIALVAQGLGDSKDPIWFRITCLIDVVIALIATLEVIRSLHLYDLNPIKERESAIADGVFGDDLAEQLLERKLAAYDVNARSISRARDRLALSLTVAVVTAVLGGILLIR
jgi:hypothetical protein